MSALFYSNEGKFFDLEKLLGSLYGLSYFIFNYPLNYKNSHLKQRVLLQKSA